MARITPDPIMGHAAPLLDGETLVAEFRADRLAYWRGHLILAVALGTAAGLFLLWQGNPYPVAGVKMVVPAVHQSPHRQQDGHKAGQQEGRAQD